MHSIQLALWMVATLVLVALVFDFMNGFHDAANSIATVVSTGVLKPQQAVVFAAAFNVIAYFIFHLKVAQTVGKGTIDPEIVGPSSFRVEHNTHNDSWSSSPVGMCAG
ncbi:inorganic phosphate transporter, partial [Burkholderia vietnamiensis]|uniref:inorganic phosphate transporter n=1 Tax=Burkholderia vietnamiensis TaxID=60552 RepID=UPI001E62F3A2